MTNTIIWFMKSILSSLFIFFVFLNSAVHAEDDNQGYCQNAETTADLVQCTGNHYEAEADHLNEVYKSLIEKADEASEFASLLRTNQEDWIAFRDHTCELAGKIYEGGSLQRVQVLNCRASMTGGRSDQLKGMLRDVNADNIPVFATPPRWTNTLLNTYPNIFWAVGQAQGADVDCDGVNEKIVSGIEHSDNAAMTLSTLAIIESPLTGRATIQTYNMPRKKTCPPTAIPAFVQNPGTDGICIFSVIMQDEGCEDMRLQYDDQEKIYRLNKEDIAE